MRNRARAAIVVLALVSSPAWLAAQDEPGVTAFEARKAEHLLRASLPCLGCHALGGEGGQIGPDLATVRERRSPAYIRAMIDDPARVVPGAAMPRPALSPSTKDLLARYLASRPGRAPAAPAPAAPADAGPASDAGPPNGPALYGRWCASCHGAAGRGDGPNAPRLPTRPAPHADAEAISRRSDDALFDTIAAGGAIMNRSPRMPAFGGSLSSAEIRALVAHIRTLCACAGPPWSRRGEGAPK